MARAASLPLKVPELPANDDSKAAVRISVPADWRDAPFQAEVPSSNKGAHGMVVALVGLDLRPDLRPFTSWNGGWTPKGGKPARDEARAEVTAWCGQLQPLTRLFEGTFGQLLRSPVAALDPLLCARAAPLDAAALDTNFARLRAVRAQLIRLALARCPSQGTLGLLRCEVTSAAPRPTRPEQMLACGEVHLARLARQLADSEALGAEGFAALAPPKAPNVAMAWPQGPQRRPPPRLRSGRAIAPLHPGAGC